MDYIQLFNDFSFNLYDIGNHTYFTNFPQAIINIYKDNKIGIKLKLSAAVPINHSVHQ
jgi:hypothetical protein